MTQKTIILRKVFNWSVVDASRGALLNEGNEILTSCFGRHSLCKYVLPILCVF